MLQGSGAISVEDIAREFMPEWVDGMPVDLGGITNAVSVLSGGSSFVQNFPRWSRLPVWDWDVFAVITGMTRQDIINL